MDNAGGLYQVSGHGERWEGMDLSDNKEIEPEGFRYHLDIETKTNQVQSEIFLRFLV